jgi:hypothetical protein
VSFWLGLEPGRKQQLPLGSILCYTKSMKKATRVKQKVMGRPRTGTTPLMGFRADPVIRASIVRWAENQPDMPTLSEAIRRLVELGLTVKTRPKQSTPARAERAKALAGKVIDSFSADGDDVEETASRKRRLLKGPEEFRDVRVDCAKAKTK